jgi:hypothetical protein
MTSYSSQREAETMTTEPDALRKFRNAMLFEYEAIMKNEPFYSDLQPVLKAYAL